MEGWQNHWTGTPSVSSGMKTVHTGAGDHCGDMDGCAHVPDRLQGERVWLLGPRIRDTQSQSFLSDPYVSSAGDSPGRNMIVVHNLKKVTDRIYRIGGSL